MKHIKTLTFLRSCLNMSLRTTGKYKRLRSRRESMNKIIHLKECVGAKEHLNRQS